MLFEKKKHLPLVIVAATMHQTSHVTFAKFFYTSKVADPILGNFPNLVEGEHYHLMYLSSEYGLVSSDTVLSPYEEELTPRKVDALVSEFRQAQAMSHLEMYEPSEVILALPELHSQAIDRLLPDLSKLTLVHKPEINAGTGHLRQFLNFHIKQYHVPFVRVYLEEFPYNVSLKVHGGDILRCGVNIGGKLIKFVEEVEVSEVNPHDNTFRCQNGQVWTPSEIERGLTEDEKRYIAQFYESSCHSHESVRVDVSLSQVRDEIASAKKYQGVA